MKLLKTLALMVFFSFALVCLVSADVAMGPMIAVIGLVYVLIAAVLIIAVVFAIKLIMKLTKKNK